MKRRFGISLSKDLVEKIDELSRQLGVSRSELIQDILAEVIEDRSHLLTPHTCRGVLIVVSRGGNSEVVSRILERYSCCIITRTHHHAGGVCIDIGLVEGDSNVILKLENELRKLRGVGERYLPFYCVR